MQTITLASTFVKNSRRSYRHARSSARGFTLVEILIVVIILGILAAIVIPQFTNASTDARKNSTLGQLQTCRSAVQLYKLQHNDTLPDLTTVQWGALLNKTDISGNQGTTGALGPYLESMPKNPLNSNTKVVLATGTPDSTTGWVYDNTTGTLTATNQTASVLFDEGTGTVQ